MLPSLADSYADLAALVADGRAPAGTLDDWSPGGPSRLQHGAVIAAAMLAGMVAAYRSVPPGTYEVAPDPVRLSLVEREWRSNVGR
jgi:hypothetical protein